MIKGREKNPDVVRSLNTLRTRYVVYDKEHFSPETVLVGQKNTIPNYPQNITYADMTGVGDIQEKERLLELWKY